MKADVVLTFQVSAVLLVCSVSTCILDMLHILPAVVLESVECHGLPIDSKRLSVLYITKCRDLERKQCEGSTHRQILLLVDFLWLASVGIILDSEVIVQELAVEAANDDDLVWADLAHASTLSGGDRHLHLSLGEVHFFPLTALEAVQVEGEALDGLGVLLVGVLDAAEHVDEAMVEMAAGVVMSSLIDSWELKPLIDGDVVELNAIGCIVYLLPGARDDDVSIEDGAAGVAMTGEVHSLLLQELEVVGTRVVLVNDLAALEHAIWECLVVATTDHEYTWLLESDLDHLEVVGEVSLEVNKLVHAVFVLDVENGDCPRVLLEDVQL